MDWGEWLLGPLPTFERGEGAQDGVEISSYETNHHPPRGAHKQQAITLLLPGPLEIEATLSAVARKTEVCWPRWRKRSVA